MSSTLLQVIQCLISENFSGENKISVACSRLNSIRLDLRLFSGLAHMLGNACIDHGWLKATKCITFRLLRLLKFLEQFSFHTFKLLGFTLVVRNLLFEIWRLVVHILTCVLYLLSYILVLTRHANILLLLNLVLSFLRLEVVLLTHPI